MPRLLPIARSLSSLFRAQTLLAAAAATGLISAPGAAAGVPDGGIVWMEIRAVDVSRAQAFYSGLFGWTFVPLGPAAALFRAPNLEGMINAEPGHVPGQASMTGYFKVAKVRDACELAARLGGSIAVTPRPLPGKGSFCVVNDTEQNRLGLISDEPAP
ncbi:MAG: VOC family protein [Elusimicrobia bacterium]|nr:VOC family protein [Elusimicrobiota bacterium]